MYERLVAPALEKYGLEYRRVRPVEKGYRNEIYPIELPDGRLVQLTFFKAEPDSLARVRRADAVSAFTARKGLPTRRRIDQRTLQLKSDRHLVIAALYDYLPGATIAWEAYTKAHIKLLGKTMSDLHAALADFPAEGQPSVVDESLALLERMERYFADQTVADALKAKLDLVLAADFHRLKRLLTGCRTLPGRQQLHMDFVRGNILFTDMADGPAVSGILDFEKTSHGHPFFDVARTLAFLLVDCKYKSEDQVRRYFLESGYHKRGTAPLAYAPRLLDGLVEFFLLHDLYKFLRHTPYESLPANEHFTRTVSILVRSGMLHYS